MLVCEILLESDSELITLVEYMSTLNEEFFGSDRSDEDECFVGGNWLLF